MHPKIAFCKFLEDNDLRIPVHSLAAPQQRDPGTDSHDFAAVDARLVRLCAAWASLPEHVILAILSLVDSAGVVEAERLQPRTETRTGSTAVGKPRAHPGRLSRHSSPPAVPRSSLGLGDGDRPFLARPHPEVTSIDHAIPRDG